MKKRMKIGQRMLISFLIVIFLGAIASGVQAFQLMTADDDHEQVLNDYGFAQGYVSKAMMALTDTRYWLIEMSEAQTDAEVALCESMLAEARAVHDENAKLADATVTVDSEMEILLRLKDGVGAYYGVQDEWVSRMKGTNAIGRASMREELRSVIDPMYEDLFAVHGELLDSKVALGVSERDALSATSTRTLVIGLVISVITILLGIAMSVYVSRLISVPVAQLIDSARRLEGGDLNFDLQLNSGTELDTFGEAFTDMTGRFKGIIEDVEHTLGEMSNGVFNGTSTIPEAYVGEFKGLLDAQETIKVRLSDTLSQINVAADQVASGADQVASASQALSQGATEQASAVEELAATVNDINGHVQRTGSAAVEASDKTNEAGSMMMQCNNQMNEMVGAMDDISRTSVEIGKIIKTIEDIAFQTNILALNAAVEAARAGNAGKGFAVVADEVRNLAAKSAEASQNTAGLIEASMAAVERGAKIVNSTAERLAEVVGNAQEVTSMVSDIASNAKEQADSIEQVTSGIDQISCVVQTNSATAEQSAAASQELSGQAVLLKDLVEKFRLKTSV